MKRFRFARWLIIAIAILGFLPSMTQADDGQIDIFIDPATGYTITKPGSYVVVANVTMTADVPAITIMSGVHDVTIDLKGHTITGTGPAGGSADGIGASGADRVRVFNGRVQNFGDEGIQTGDGAHIHDVVVADCGGDGIETTSEALIERCTATGNGKKGSEAGISVGSNSAVIDCVVSANNPSSTGNTKGIEAGAGCTLIGNTVTGNVSPDDFCTGIDAGSNALILNNTVEGNQAAGEWSVVGIGAGNGSVIANNTCVDNVNNVSGSAHGIEAGSNCVIRSNTCSGNKAGISIGIRALPGAIIVGNTCRANRAQGIVGWGIGILAASDSLIRENVCEANDAAGIGTFGAGIATIFARSRIENNNCVNHTGVGGARGIGIYLFDGAANNFVSGNNTSGNSTAGIDAITGGGPGIDNLIIDNRASGNGTDFDFGASNSTGPIADETGSGTISTINPLANVRY